MTKHLELTDNNSERLWVLHYYKHEVLSSDEPCEDQNAHSDIFKSLLAGWDGKAFKGVLVCIQGMQGSSLPIVYVEGVLWNFCIESDGCHGLMNLIQSWRILNMCNGGFDHNLDHSHFHVLCSLAKCIKLLDIWISCKIVLFLGSITIM